MKISEPKFLLREPKGDNITQIQLHVRFNGVKFVYSTGESIHPNNWDFVSQRAKSTRKYPEHSDVNFWLGKVESEIKNIFRNLRIDNIVPTISILKNELSIRLNDKPAPQKIDLFGFISKYIENATRIKSYTTIQVYNNVFRRLKEYTILQKIKLDFENIDLDFHGQYTQYMIMNLGYSLNTVSKHIRMLKVFLNAATESGDNTTLIFKSKKFSKPNEDVAKIYLKEQEIDRLYNLNLSFNPTLDRVRDLFIVGCYTGLRFSDLAVLRSENIQDGLIKIKTQKTGEIVYIPFKGRVVEIYKKYNNNFPEAISNQKMNKYLKDLGQFARIDDPIIVTKMLKGVKTDKQYKKYELITVHSCRRSMCTNAYLAKIPSINIMKISGHRSEKVFMSYIRFSQEENATLLNDHEFFN